MTQQRGKLSLKRIEYDDVYFGERKSHYSNYLESSQNSLQKAFIEKFIKKNNFGPDDKILELGAGIGFFGKIAQAKGLKFWYCIDWSKWCKANQVYGIVDQDAIKYLKELLDDSFDYIVSFGFLECCDDGYLAKLIPEMKRVGKKQIHGMYLSGNESYNIKTLEEWQSLFDDSVIIENYG